MRRRLCAEANADDRTVKRVLRGLGPQNGAWEKITEAMAKLGVDQAPPSPLLASVLPAGETDWLLIPVEAWRVLP